MSRTAFTLNNPNKSIINNFVTGITNQIPVTELENLESLKKIVHVKYRNPAVMGTLTLMHKCIYYYIPYVRRCLSFRQRTFMYSGPGSSVGIATELRAGRSGIEKKKIPVGTRFSARTDRPWDPPSLL